SLPTLKIVPPTSWSECDNAIKNITQYDFVIFTSQNSVDWFLKRLELFEKVDELRSKRIIVIGSKTEQRLVEENFQIYFKPQKFSSEGLVNELREILIAGQKILLPQSEIGNDFIKIELEKMGVLVDRVPVYNIDIPELEDVEEQIKLLNEKEIDVFIFTSPSTFDNFLRLMRVDSPQNFFKDKIIAVIGPTTRKHIEGFGLNVQIEAQTSTFEDLINSIIKFFEKK
ncbi:MAG: uroporphyrinogen-III synthase, partial [Ignavibacteria bacterium]